MWKCSNCGEKVDEEFTSCWNCLTNRDGSPSPLLENIQQQQQAEKESQNLLRNMFGGPLLDKTKYTEYYKALSSKSSEELCVIYNAAGTEEYSREALYAIENILKEREKYETNSKSGIKADEIPQWRPPRSIKERQQDLVAAGRDFLIAATLLIFIILRYSNILGESGEYKIFHVVFIGFIPIPAELILILAFPLMLLKGSARLGKYFEK